MKNVLTLATMLLISGCLFSQTFEVQLPSGVFQPIQSGENSIDLGADPLQKIILKAGASGFSITTGAGFSMPILTTPTTVQIPNINHYNTQFTIVDGAGTKKSDFTLKKLVAAGDGAPSVPQSVEIIYPKNTIYEVITSRYTIQTPVTNRGFEISSGGQFTGPDYTHIFLDQYGNTLLSVLPAGIPNRQYVVHVFYLVDISNANDITYSVKQTKGSFNPGLVFSNTNSLSQINLQSSDAPNKKKTVTYAWYEDIVLLSPATDDLEFEVFRNDTGGKAYNLNQTKLATHKIKMTKTYHGSFDVGLLNTRLKNPTFTIVPTSDTLTVKRAANGDRGMVAGMATLYSSPIVALKKLFGGDVQNHQLFGRSFFDDHKLYERIYPTIGVRLGNESFENLFFGFNWEFARGGNLFLGWHYAKVNTYKQTDFKFGEDPVSQEIFDLNTDTKWKTDFAVGFNLDVQIINNLFSQPSSN